jgi:hypothetical protein
VVFIVPHDYWAAGGTAGLPDGDVPAGIWRAWNRCWSPTSDSIQIKARAAVDESVDSHAYA